MFSSRNHAKMKCGLKVDTTDPGWYESMTKLLRKIKGASYTINVEEGMAYISGRVNPSKILRKLKSGKYADLCWVITGNQMTYGNGNAYYQAMEPHSLALSQPPAGYWHNHHYDPMSMVPGYYHQWQLPMPYPYHDFQYSGYWDRGLPRWD